MNRVPDDFKFRVRAQRVVENVVPGLLLAFEQADGGTVEGAVGILII